uniref:Uncharacterized protein n=1 Tax=Rhizophora mucronata TaxID=61149 RepID=A0A2P2PXE4_RHIMU
MCMFIASLWCWIDHVSFSLFMTR